MKSVVQLVPLRVPRVLLFHSSVPPLPPPHQDHWHSDPDWVGTSFCVSQNDVFDAGVDWTFVVAVVVLVEIDSVLHVDAVRNDRETLDGVGNAAAVAVGNDAMVARVAAVVNGGGNHEDNSDEQVVNDCDLVIEWGSCDGVDCPCAEKTTMRVETVSFPSRQDAQWDQPILGSRAEIPQSWSHPRLAKVQRLRLRNLQYRPFLFLVSGRTKLWRNRTCRRERKRERKER